MNGSLDTTLGVTGSYCVSKRISRITEGEFVELLGEGREVGEEREVLAIGFKSSSTGVRDSG